MRAVAFVGIIISGIALMYALTFGVGEAPHATRQVEAPVVYPPLPDYTNLKKDECIETTVLRITPRLVPECIMGKPGEPTHADEQGAGDCGLDVVYAFGDVQRSYQTNIEVKDTWRAGDPIRLCRLDAPSRCEIGGDPDDHALYRATNLRTKGVYEQANRNYATCPSKLPD